MNRTYSKQMLLLPAAALLLAGVVGSFPHGHLTILSGPSEPCPGAEPRAPGASAHLVQADSGEGADGCTICFFSRCASQTTAVVAGDLVIALEVKWLAAETGVRPVRILGSLNEARGPPAA